MGCTYKLNGRAVTEDEFRGEQREAHDRLFGMLDSGQAPACMTDAVFLEGHCNGNQFERRPEIGDFYKACAEAGGVDTTGKVYLSGLARYPGDKHAWVAGRGDAERVINRNGWGAEGAISKAVSNVAQPIGAKVAPSLVAEAIEDRLTAEGRESVTGQEAADLVVATTEKLAQPAKLGVVEHLAHKGRGY